MNEDVLFDKNRGLIGHVINRYFSERVLHGSGFTQEDLFQIGSIGLVKAIRDFKPELGFTFATYAVPKIYGEIQKEIRDNNGIIKSSRMARLIFQKVRKRKQKPSLEELEKEFNISERIAADILDLYNLVVYSLDVPINAGSSEKELFASDVIADLSCMLEDNCIKKFEFEEKLSRLDEKEKQVILLSLKGVRQTDVGIKLGISQVHVSRLIKRAIIKMNEEVEELIC